MQLSNRFASERGSASLEFITVGLVMLVPLVYLVLTMSSIQAGALAAEGAARQAARVFVQAQTLEQANAAASSAVQFALDNHGVDASDAAVTITCAPDPGDCLARKGFVTVQVAIAVDLPLAPPVLTGNFPLQVPLDAAATQQVSQFAGSR
ncbi:hypothetical protein CLV85_2427 [Salinibacterium amurskyense]|uniref:TadE-like protein n=1 Tax=Salinibacterium amurskyense TaxID=205941 RepID=A0A2M9D3S9_9MICO|nr:hypothetical protein [Salinibacterium amurskyense]PJJ78847.1 hypothetical protein CLV85_2427 [Salinibacterium amurskyense]RLQ80906.1 hypothetical protein D9C83_12050 [Salinibacterium amurskyense]GHD83574.1 hypothetical protein GCM10007394_24200 [Salinibacterium amurskyense]